MEEMWEVGTAACGVYDKPRRHAMPGAPASAVERMAQGEVPAR